MTTTNEPTAAPTVDRTTIEELDRRTEERARELELPVARRALDELLGGERLEAPCLLP